MANEACKKERILAQRDERAKQKDNAPRPQKKDKGGNSANVTEVKGGGKGQGQSSQQSNSPEPNYLFSNEDVYPIFLMLMARGAIELPQPKVPDEVDKVDDPKYSHYHRGGAPPDRRMSNIEEAYLQMHGKGRGSCAQSRLATLLLIISR